MFKPAVTDPEQIKAMLQKTLTGTADNNSGTSTTNAATGGSISNKEDEYIKEDRYRYRI
jgi:hypothetical protein